ncbi:MAG: hypothetical protein Q8M94_02160 [Ignavibacteria bacterium]|nr:hypothetical protein [Ignavibacteria bacterium]
MEASDFIKNYRDCIGWVRHFALPYKSLRAHKIEFTDTYFLVTFRSDEHYMLRYSGEAVLRPINGWLIQNLCERISNYTEQEFKDKTGLGTTLEIYEYKNSNTGEKK